MRVYHANKCLGVTKSFFLVMTTFRIQKKIHVIDELIDLKKYFCVIQHSKVPFWYDVYIFQEYLVVLFY